MRVLIGLSACLLLLVGCDDNPPDTDAGTGTDSGTEIDSGSETMDAGGLDPCTSDDPAETVGCNGGVTAGAQPENEFGGTCTPDSIDNLGEDYPGTCTNTGGWCSPFDENDDITPVGTCMQICTPSDDYFSTRGDCPMGSRCIDTAEFFGVALCHKDCNSDADCASGECWGVDEGGWGICLGRRLDTIDGGTSDPDAGAPADDGGAPADAGDVADAGVAMDSGVDGGGA